MLEADALIALIRESKLDEALAMLDASTGLATARAVEEGPMKGATPLHWAAHRNAAALCERLVELGADVNDSATEWWRTPLAWAADAGCADAVELLLQNGADVNQDVVVGMTALHAVAMGGSSGGSRDPEGYGRTAKILIANGADIDRRGAGDQGRTALDHATRSGNASVVTVLQERRAAATG